MSSALLPSSWRAALAGAAALALAAGPPAALPAQVPPPDPAAQLRAEIARWKNAPRSDRRDVAMYVRCLEADPAAVRTLLDEMGPLNAAAAGSAGHEAELVTMLVESWARRDRAGVLEWMRRLPNTTLGGRAQLVPALVWAEDDPAAALAATLTPEFRRSGSVYASVLRQYFRRDPRGALAALLAAPTGVMWSDAYAGQLGEVAARAPDVAVGAYAAPRLAGHRPRLGPPIAHAWAQEDAEAALAWAAALPGRDDRLHASASALAVLARRDPTAALPLIEQFPVGIYRDGLSMEAAAELARRDPAAAGAWLQTQFTGPSLELAYLTVQRQLLELDPAAALAWFPRLPEGLRGNPGVIAETARHGAEGHLAQTLAWARALPAAATPVSARDIALAALLNYWARHDPRAAADAAREFVSEQGAWPDDGAVFSRWVEVDAPGALTWAWSLPPGHARTRALELLAGNWAGLNLTAGEIRAALQQTPLHGDEQDTFVGQIQRAAEFRALRR